MKTLLTFILIISVHPVFSQMFPDTKDCGTWEPDTLFIDWHDIDTLCLKCVVNDTGAREWTYDDEVVYPRYNIDVTLVYCRCGCQPNDYIYSQKRICKLTGIIQEWKYTISWHYVPKPKSDYQKTVELFNK